MNSWKISVDVLKVGNVAEQVLADVSDIKNQIAMIIESMKKLDSMWDGIASVAFLNEFSGDCERLAAFCEFLEKWCQSTAYAVKYYEGNEASINDTVFWLGL